MENANKEYTNTQSLQVVEAMSFYFKEYDKIKEYEASGERILCSAIHYLDAPTSVHGPKNITKGVVLCGLRHNDIISQCSSLTGRRTPEMGKYVQGFLTNLNRFVNREEAFYIAFAALQIKNIANTRGTSLYSEDIY